MLNWDDPELKLDILPCPYNHISDIVYSLINNVTTDTTLVETIIPIRKFYNDYCAVHASDRFVFLGSTNGNVLVYDSSCAINGTPIPIYSSPISCIEFCSDSSLLVVASDKAVKLMKWCLQSQLTEISSHEFSDAIKSCQILSNHILITLINRTALLLQVGNDEISTYKNVNQCILCDLGVVLCTNSTLSIYSLQNMENLFHHSFTSDIFSCITQAHLLALGLADGSVFLFDLSIPTIVHFFRIGIKPISTLSFNNSHLLCCSVSGSCVSLALSDFSKTTLSLDIPISTVVCFDDVSVALILANRTLYLISLISCTIIGTYAALVDSIHMSSDTFLAKCPDSICFFETKTTLNKIGINRNPSIRIAKTESKIIDTAHNYLCSRIRNNGVNSKNKLSRENYHKLMI